jgi:hypothetical protein
MSQEQLRREIYVLAVEDVYSLLVKQEGLIAELQRRSLTIS